MIMKSAFQFRNINIGDLLIQQIPNPIKIEDKIIRRGIITNIQNNISTIEWALDISDSPINLMRTTTMLNGSLRKMIMDGYILHYPVRK